MTLKLLFRPWVSAGIFVSLAALTSCGPTQDTATGEPAIPRLFYGGQEVSLSKINDPIPLTIRQAPITIDGRLATSIEIVQPDGTPGLWVPSGQPFTVEVTNELPDPTLLEWHGAQPVRVKGHDEPIPAQGSHRFDFPAAPPGTGWVAASLGLQRQELAAAPLIVVNASPSTDAPTRDITLLLQDFSFRRPEEVLEALIKTNSTLPAPSLSLLAAEDVALSVGDATRQIASNSEVLNKDAASTLNVLAQELPDASYLPDVPVDRQDKLVPLMSRRTVLELPAVSSEPKERIRLRVINAAAMSGFLFTINSTDAEAVAMDGRPVMPLPGHQFEISVGQSCDFVFTRSQDNPEIISAQIEGNTRKTMLMLLNNPFPTERVFSAEPGGHLPAEADQVIEAFGMTQGSLLRSEMPLPTQHADRRMHLHLGGPDEEYRWKITGETSAFLKEGERVELEIANTTPLGQPIHLAGHKLQVTAVDGVPITGALRESVLVPSGRIVTVQFDANNPGRWPLGTQLLYPRVGGLLTTLAYEDNTSPMGRE